MLTFEVRNFRTVNAELAAIARRSPDTADKIEREFLNEERKRLKAEPYPPKRPGQTYKRTGNLANRWAVEKQSGWALVNRADYSRYVVGLPSEQAWMHEGRWWSAAHLLVRDTPLLIDMISKRYAQEFDGFTR